MSNSILLEVSDLQVNVDGQAARQALVESVTFTILRGESVGLVGESGSGKSMTMKSVMRLHPSTISVNGDIQFDGESVLGFNSRDLARYRSSRVSMIYQDPRAHTNPLRTIGDFLIEGVTLTKLLSKAEAISRARTLLEEMGIADAEARLSQYPHQLSGGLLQRVMIAAALMNEPDLILADEPTTALDVTVQSEVVAILKEQVAQRGIGLLFVTHDLDLAAAVTDRLLVMYAGNIVESGPSSQIYTDPRHPYTAALLASRPSLDEVKPLQVIPGRPSAAFEVGPGCVFSDRCPYSTQLCKSERPPLTNRAGRSVACHYADELAPKLRAEALDE